MDVVAAHNDGRSECPLRRPEGRDEAASIVTCCIYYIYVISRKNLDMPLIAANQDICTLMARPFPVPILIFLVGARGNVIYKLYRLGSVSIVGGRVLGVRPEFADDKNRFGLWSEIEMKTLAAFFVVALAGTAVAGPVHTGGSGSGSGSLNYQRATLWDQSFTNFVGTVDQDFPDFATYSTVQVDDFSTGGQSWNVDTVVTYFTLGFGAWPSSCSAQLSLYPKTGASPTAGDHMGNLGSVPATIVNLGSALAVVADTSGVGALQGINGDYWIGLTPTVSFGSNGQEFHLLSANPTIGDGARNRNEGGSFGIGTDWVDGPGLFAGLPNTDHCFTLGGDVVPAPSAAALLALGGVFAGRRRR